MPKYYFNAPFKMARGGRRNRGAKFEELGLPATRAQSAGSTTRNAPRAHKPRSSRTRIMTSCLAQLIVLAGAVALGALLGRRAAFFAQPPASRRDTARTSAGHVDLPIRYHDGSLIGAFWLVDPAKAAALMPASLEPLVLPGGLGAVAGLFAFEYRNTSIGAYGELGLAVQAVRKGSGASVWGYAWDMLANVLHCREMLAIFEQRDSGLYVVTLPVTTAGAMAAGREVWGYNRYLAATASNFSDVRRASFALDGELRLTLEQGRLALPTRRSFRSPPHARSRAITIVFF